MNRYFIDVIRNHYCDFKGCATRTEFWMYQLFAFLAGIVFGVLNVVIFGKDGIPVLPFLLGLALLLPNLSITARRLHDIGRSGWWQLIAIIPIINIIGSIVLLVFLVLPSKK